MKRHGERRSDCSVEVVPDRFRHWEHHAEPRTHLGELLNQRLGGGCLLEPALRLSNSISPGGRPVHARPGRTSLNSRIAWSMRCLKRRRHEGGDLMRRRTAPHVAGRLKSVASGRRYVAPSPPVSTPESNHELEGQPSLCPAIGRRSRPAPPADRWLGCVLVRGCAGGSSLFALAARMIMPRAITLVRSRRHRSLLSAGMA